jgi:predicted branched-subunit amino acid permease
MVYGVLAIGNGIPTVAAMAMSSVVFAGSAQFLLAQLFAVGAPWLVMVSSVGLVNLRHALYSASVAPHLGHLSPGWKAALAYVLTDEAYAAALPRLRDGAPGPHRHWHLLGAGLGLWTSWQASTAVGIVVGAQIPRDLPLDFALPLTFIAIVVPMIRSRAAVLAAVVAGTVALATAGWPHKLGLMASALAGIAAGWIAAGRRTEGA